MKKNSLIEYPAYLLIKLFGLLVISLPLKLNFILGRTIGILGYYLLKKKRRLVKKNLKTAFANSYSLKEIERIAKKAFVSLALNITEALYIPRIDFRYINKHIRIENQRYLDAALEKGNGVILLAYHMGNWELANITCGLQGYTYKVIVNEQRYPLVNELLNRYRESKGCKTISRGVALREILKALKLNEVVAMVGDQGGREGCLSNFFGLPTSTPTGFIRFAQNTGASIIPAIIVRERRFYHRIILEKPIERESADNANDDQGNLEHYLAESNRILERFVSLYPQEYFWFYKIWKYSPFRQVVILSDGKGGHLRQAQAALKTISATLRDGPAMPCGGHNSQFTVHSNVIEIRFKNKFLKILARACDWFGLDISEFCLTKESCAALKEARADLVISCGSGLSSINLALADENLAKSICIMNPGRAKRKRFGLVIIPKHDRPHPAKNIVITLGALNLIDEDYLKEQAEILKSKISAIGGRSSIGLLIGGDTKKYRLTQGIMNQVIQEIKKASLDLGADILITTSRRTPKAIEKLLRKEFSGFKNCPLLVIANEKNIPEAVGGILGIADFILVSAESVSMVSEAVSSGKYVGVFRLKPKGLNFRTRHGLFLKNLETQGYIYSMKKDAIADRIKSLLQGRPIAKRLNDRFPVEEAMRKLL
jgi:KDO2-lipid IV(A) lauroyltransferase